MVGTADMQGFRVEMEDALTAALSLSSKHAGRAFFGVYDGHGGSRCSKYLETAMVKAIGDLQDPTDEGALKKACMAVDAEFLKRQNEREDGSTAVFCVVTPQEGKKMYDIVTANIGDSRAILIRSNGKVEPLTEDHKPNNPEEMERIQRAGGSVSSYRVDGQLALSRAIGDWNYKDNAQLKPEDQKVIPIPDVTSITANEGDTLLICCDGLFEQMTNEEVGGYVHKQLEETKYADPASVLQGLLDLSLERGSKDNMSALAVCFRDGTKYHKSGGEYIPGPYHQHKHNEKFKKAYLADAQRHGYEEEKLMTVVPKPPNGFKPSEEVEEAENPMQQMISKALEGQMGEDVKQRLLMAMFASQRAQGGGNQ
uniref:PPM-type phosphatase domain-containing protein n=2 Tax=Lotharella globosa TaxID=91324 RepID=A0A7S3ZC62_9EUKA